MGFEQVIALRSAPKAYVKVGQRGQMKAKDFAMILTKSVFANNQSGKRVRRYAITRAVHHFKATAKAASFRL
jgi:hypothetical protein